jgi:hypothetical protein
MVKSAIGQMTDGLSSTDRERENLFDKTGTAKNMTLSILFLLLRVLVAPGTCLPSRCLATIGGIHIQTRRRMEGIYGVVVGLGSGTMIYIPSPIKGLHNPTLGK